MSAAAPSVLARVKTRFLGWSQRLRKTARALAFGSMGLLAVFSGIYPKARDIPAPLNLLLVLALVGLAAAPLLALLGHLARLGIARRTEVSASAQGLGLTRAGRGREVPASAIRQAVVLPRREGAELRLTLVSGDELAIRVDSLAAADALLAALDLDPDLRRAEVAWNPLAGRLAAGTLAFVATLCALSGLAGAAEGTQLHVALAFLMMVVPFLAAGAAAHALRRLVSVGRDGIRVHRRFEKPHELRFDDVLDVQLRLDHLVLSHSGGGDHAGAAAGPRETARRAAAGAHPSGARALLGARGQPRRGLRTCRPGPRRVEA